MVVILQAQPVRAEFFEAVLVDVVDPLIQAVSACHISAEPSTCHFNPAFYANPRGPRHSMVVLTRSMHILSPFFLPSSSPTLRAHTLRSCIACSRHYKLDIVRR